MVLLKIVPFNPRGNYKFNRCSFPKHVVGERERYIFPGVCEGRRMLAQAAILSTQYFFSDIKSVFVFYDSGDGIYGWQLCVEYYRSEPAPTRGNYLHGEFRNSHLIYTLYFFLQVIPFGVHLSLNTHQLKYLLNGLDLELFAHVHWGTAPWEFSTLQQLHLMRWCSHGPGGRSVSLTVQVQNCLQGRRKWNLIVKSKLHNEVLGSESKQQRKATPLPIRPPPQ